MEYKKEFEIARLISRQRLGILTVAEQEYLDKWLAAAEENRMLYDRLAEGISFRERKELEDQTDTELVFRQVTSKARRSLVRRRMWRWGAAAAILVCGVMTAALWRTNELSEVASLAPLSEHVELILPDGKRVALNGETLATEQLPEGFEVVQETGEESKLAYLPAESDAEVAVSFITLNVPKKEEYKIELPDGTIVYLNSCSSLRFPERFKPSSREVYLSGEAAFSVKKDATSPFSVHAGERTIVVTGTRFHVSAYDDDPLWQTTLVDGAIAVTGDGDTVVLRPHQQYMFNQKNETGCLREVSAEKVVFVPWMSGTQTFEAAEFEEIVRRLQRWYDITVDYRDDCIRKKRFTATIDKKESLDMFLTRIEQTTNIEFILDGNHLTVMEKKSNNSSNH